MAIAPSRGRAQCRERHAGGIAGSGGAKINQIRLPLAFYRISGQRRVRPLRERFYYVAFICWALFEGIFTVAASARSSFAPASLDSCSKSRRRAEVPA